MYKFKKKLWNIIKEKQYLLNMFSNFYNILNFNKKKVKGNYNIIYRKGAFLKNTKIHISGDNNKILIGKESMLTDTYIHIVGNNNVIKIGERVAIGKCDLWREDNYGKIYIGNNTTIISGHIACTENYGEINIGEDCMFSHNVTFRNGDSHSIIDNQSNNRINYAKNIYIGDQVWIGENSCILKGVTIKNECIIATNAVVTKSSESNCILAGNPASIKKKNITWVRERI